VPSGGVGKSVRQGNAPGGANGADNEKLVPPGLKGAFNMTDGETDETAQADAHAVETVVKEDKNMSHDLHNIGLTHLYQIDILEGCS
jgi:hypothetical protein